MGHNRFDPIDALKGDVIDLANLTKIASDSIDKVFDELTVPNGNAIRERLKGHILASRKATVDSKNLRRINADEFLIQIIGRVARDLEYIVQAKLLTGAESATILSTFIQGLMKFMDER